jgi:hypothetical protein
MMAWPRGSNRQNKDESYTAQALLRKSGNASTAKNQNHVEWRALVFTRVILADSFCQPPIWYDTYSCAYCYCSCRRGNNVSELWPPTGLLVIPRLIHEYGKLWRNDTNDGKPNNSERTCPSDTLSTTNPHGLTQA